MKQWLTWAAVTLLTVSLTACGPAEESAEQGTEQIPEQSQPSEQTDLSAYRTDYVGDNANVVAIASGQDYPGGYRYDHIAIQSSEEPYGLTVYLSGGAGAEDAGAADFGENAETTFSLIGNLGVLEYRDAAAETVLASFTRED